MEPELLPTVVTLGSWGMIRLVTRPNGTAWATLLFTLVGLAGAIMIMSELVWTIGDWLTRV